MRCSWGGAAAVGRPAGYTLHAIQIASRVLTQFSYSLGGGIAPAAGSVPSLTRCSPPAAAHLRLHAPTGVCMQKKRSPASRSSPGLAASKHRSPLGAAAAAGAPGSPLRHPLVKMAAGALAVCALLTLASMFDVGRGSGLRRLGAAQIDGGSGAADTAASGATPVPQQLNAAGKQLLTPTRIPWKGHDLYFESPLAARGLVLILHKCGRSGSDYWPRSAACAECTGLPESLAHTQQALARGYAVAALNSLDRRTDGGGRCFAWSDDAGAAADAARQLPTRLGLPPGAPVYLMGTSSGGSLALRLCRLVDVDGVVGGELGGGGDRGAEATRVGCPAAV